MSRDPYEILGINADASPDDVRRRYRELAQRYHPDLNGGDPTAAWMFRAVKDARDQILDGGWEDRTSRGRNDGPERREAARPQGTGAPDQRGWVPSTMADDVKLVEELCARIMAGTLSGVLTLWGWTIWEVGEAWKAATGGLLPGNGETWNLAAGGTSLIVAIVVMTVQDRTEDPGVHGGSPLGRMAKASAMTCGTATLWGLVAMLLG